MTSRGPLLVAAAAIVCAAGTIASLPTAVSLVLALPLVLFLPGYALLAALDGRGLPGAHRLVLATALSVAADIAVALVVNALPSGLTTRSWAIGLTCVVLAGCATAYLRGVGARPARDERPPIRIRWFDVLVLAVAAAVLTGAAVLARAPLSARPAEAYTILSLVRGPQSAVVVGVQSGELRARRYRLVVAGDHVVYGKSTFELQPGARLSKRIPVSGPRSAVEATLYVADQAKPYRSVFLR
jgi:uncharacterized membrane protein